MYECEFDERNRDDFSMYIYSPLHAIHRERIIIVCRRHRLRCQRRQFDSCYCSIVFFSLERRHGHWIVVLVQKHYIRYDSVFEFAFSNIKIHSFCTHTFTQCHFFSAIIFRSEGMLFAFVISQFRQGLVRLVLSRFASTNQPMPIDVVHVLVKCLAEFDRKINGITRFSSPFLPSDIHVVH